MMNTGMEIVDSQNSDVAILGNIEPIVLSDIDLPRLDRKWWTNFLDRAEQLVFPKVASATAQVYIANPKTKAAMLRQEP
jgi:hypothetical protein